MLAKTHPWTPVCQADDIVPDTGVCARVEDRHVAVFRIGTEGFFAIDNIDPQSGASVLAHLLDLQQRGMVIRSGERWTVHAD